MMDLAVITTIGSLVSITKDVIGALKDLRGLFGTGDSKRIANEAQASLDKMKDNFSVFSKRLEILSIQLEQSEALTRMVPAWLQVANLMPLWKSTHDLTQEDVQRLDGDLRNFIHDSVRDHFSTTFFRANFDQLPKVERQLDIFRAKLRDFVVVNSTLNNERTVVS